MRGTYATALQWRKVSVRLGRLLFMIALGGLLLITGPGLLARAILQDSLRVIARVPLQMHERRVTLDVMVNGHGPFAFGLDTGASGAAWVSKALLERLDLLPDGHIAVFDGSAAKGRVPLPRCHDQNRYRGWKGGCPVRC